MKFFFYANLFTSFKTINIFIKTIIAQNIKIEIFLSINIQLIEGQINILIDCRELKTHIISHLSVMCEASTISDWYIGLITH